VSFAYLRDQHGLRTRRPLPRYIARTAFFLAAAPLVPTLEAQMGGLRVVLNTSDRTMARSVFAAGDWDPLLVGTVFEALDAWGHAYRGRTFLEVGANFGVYSLPAVSEYGFARALAYEPEPTAFALLRRNIRRNGLDDRVEAVQAALSRRAGELLLSRGRGNAGDNRVVRQGAAAEQRSEIVRVSATTFDEEVAAGAIRLDDVGLVWLDVQGHETDVLAGATALLQSDIPVVLEYSTSMMDEAARAELHRLVIGSFRALVDLGWSALTNRLRFQPASAVHELVTSGRPMETDLLLL
jgi:FkbM family methyltransferase